MFRGEKRKSSGYVNFELTSSEREQRNTEAGRPEPAVRHVLHAKLSLDFGGHLRYREVDEATKVLEKCWLPQPEVRIALYSARAPKTRPEKARFA